MALPPHKVVAHKPRIRNRFQRPRVPAIVTITSLARCASDQATEQAGFRCRRSFATQLRMYHVRHLGMLALSVAYLASATLVEPQLWADPLGPLVKVLPSLLLTLATLAILDER
ncbi:hypothetical protein E5176_01335 [Ensifer adhaerens]|nr:hypothetical protein E5176_01335 [Ensifer adhaerens]